MTRARAAFGLLTAAGLTLLLAATAVCVAVLYAQSVTQAGLATILGATTPQERAVTITLAADDAGEVPDAVTTWPYSLPVDVATTIESRRVALSTQTTRGTSVRLLAGDPLAALVRVTDGQWPPSSALTGTVPVAVPVAAADALGLAVGSTATLTSADDAVPIVVAALVEPQDATDPAWAGSGAAVAGADPDAREPGPLLVTELPTVLTDRAETRWVAVADLGGVRVDQVPAVLGHVQALAAGTVLPRGAQTETVLDGVLGSVGTPLLVARSSVYLPAVLVVLSAGVALALGARLVGAVRARELWLLRARGFSTGQLLGVTAGEALAVAGPAVAFAPLLAGAALRGIGSWGPLADAGVRGLGHVPAATWGISAAVGAGGVLALVLVGGRPTAEAPETRPVLQRAGVDVVVGVLALLACWQLLRYGAPLSTDRQGLLSVDPLLVVAPALVLLAGALVTLRLLLWAAHRLEGPAARSTGIAGALGAWQVGRRRARQAGPALLVVLAVGVGTLSTTYATSWDVSQRDQAALAAGADLRVDAADAAQQDAGAAQAYAQLPGVDGAMAVLTRKVYGDGRGASLTAWDAERAPALVPLRPDLGDLAAGSALLAAARPQVPSVALPEGSTALALDVTARLHLAAPDAVPPPVEVTAVVRDAAGLLHRLPDATVRTDGSPQTLTFPLDGAGRPLTGADLIALEVTIDARLSTGPDGPQTPPGAELDVTAAAVTADGDVPLAAPTGWRATTAPGARLSPTLAALDADATFVHVSARAGLPAGPVVFTLRPTGTGEDGAGRLSLLDARDSVAVPVLSTPTLPGPDDAGGSDGAGGPGAAAGSDSTVEPPRVNLLGSSVQMIPVGRLGVVPGQGLLQGGLPGYVADLPTVSLLLYEATGRVLTADSWWLGAARHDDAVAALTAGPLGPPTADRHALAERLRTDPLGVGVVTALLLALLGAGLCAAIGVGVAAVVAIRERRGEFALLQAVGTSPAQLRASLAVEQVLLLGTGVVLGGALGVVVARLLVPQLLLDAGGGHPVPPVDVVVPWLRLGLVAGAVAGALALFVWVVTRAVMRSTLAVTLRTEGVR
ncbi:FtsX-like permease family protein [Xylanimonas cellulosilytica]|uniref:FtsX-like permease family protein n=1 Tax=Xylanimonas cellulosilytica TaxID=186189 RepID=UPI0011D10BB2|nr:FtsX-like permease family protein [Xylanimonas cellulosilytica]